MDKILDEMLPARPAKSRIRPLTVWFDRDCYQLRRRTRCLERRYRRSRDTTDRLAWIGQLRAPHHLYRQKEAAYWENLVTKNSTNPKRLWSTISGLLGKSSSTSPSPSFSAGDYQRMLSAKLDKLRAASATSPPPTFVPTYAVFSNFRLITDTELRKLLTTCNLKSYELDPLPPFVMVDVLDEIVPFLLYLFNRSLSKGFLPSSQKCSIIFPALKQSSLLPSLCQNYRPIANLSFLSMTLERLVSLQLLPYLEKPGLFPCMQSGFRAHHSIETALLSLLSDIYTAMDTSHVTILALFDASSAFDMVDNEILLQRLETSFGLSGSPLNWFRSYLSDRSQMVVLGDTLALLGFLSNLASLRALFWALSSTSYSQLIFLVYLLNTLPMATSMLTTSRLMSMVLLLNSLILLNLLHLLLLILILGCLLIVCHLILPRHN